MSIPSMFVGLILSTLYGALFHFWRGGNAGRLLIYLILAWIGFWLGHFTGSYLKVTFDTLGQLHVFFATLGSAILLAVGYWLSQVRVEDKA